MRVDREAFERVPQERQVFASAALIGSSRLVWNLSQFVRGEVRSVGDRSKVRHEWRIDGSNCLPVYTIEKRVRSDLLDIQSLVGRSNEAE